MNINVVGKIKLYGYTSLSLLCLFSAIYCIGLNEGELSSSGGKSGLFYLTMSLFAAIIDPVFKDNSISVIYFLLSMVFMLLAWKYYKIINAVKNPSI